MKSSLFCPYDNDSHFLLASFLVCQCKSMSFSKNDAVVCKKFGKTVLSMTLFLHSFEMLQKQISGPDHFPKDFKKIKFLFQKNITCDGDLPNGVPNDIFFKQL